MKILLIDADSTIPNLALMKLSTFHKSSGDSVELVRLKLPYYPGKKKKQYTAPCGFDQIYCSVVFEGNLSFVHGNGILFGGTGVDLKTTLSDGVESCDPDYSIYPDNDTSYGFISRGCIRKCSFCKVPKKEGYIRKVSNISDIVRHKKVKFMDNNILALPEHLEILQELSERKIKCCFNQGLDIRLLTEQNSQALSKLKYLGDYVFAFDTLSSIYAVEQGLSLMPWRKDYRIKFFIYTSPDMSFSEIVRRVVWCGQNKCLPYIMRDISCWDSPFSDFYVDLASWCNQPNLFKKIDFKTFLQKRHPEKPQRVVESLACWESGL